MSIQQLIDEAADHLTDLPDAFRDDALGRLARAHINSAIECLNEAKELSRHRTALDGRERGAGPAIPAPIEATITTEDDGTTTIQFPPGTFARLAAPAIGVHVTCASCGASSELSATTCSACGASDTDE